MFDVCEVRVADSRTRSIILVLGFPPLLVSVFLALTSAYKNRAADARARLVSWTSPLLKPLLHVTSVLGYGVRGTDSEAPA